MQQVNERLAKSKQEYVNSRFEAGKAAGFVWAKDSAEYVDLLKVQAIDASDYSEAHLRDGAWDDIYAAAGGNCGNRDEFAEQVLGSDQADDHYAAGFIVGAQGYFEEVEDVL